MIGTPPARVLAGQNMVFGMRHEPEHQTADIGDAGKIIVGAIRVERELAARSFAIGVHVAKGGDRFAGCDVATFAVGNRAGQAFDATGPHAPRRRVDGEVYPTALELTRRVVAQRAGQQTDANQCLETVADADDRSTGGHERSQRITKSSRQLQREQPTGAEAIA